MTDYYLLMPRETLGTAAPIAADDEYVCRRLSRQLMRADRIDDLQRVLWTRDREGEAPDWLWGVYQTPLLSERFRRVVDEHLTDADDLQWLETFVISPDSREEVRWIPHFPSERDILDPEWTDWGPSGLPIAWFLSESKLDGLTITTRPHTSGDLIVSESMMAALRQASLTGYRSMRARVAGAGPRPF